MTMAETNVEQGFAEKVHYLYTKRDSGDFNIIGGDETETDESFPCHKLIVALHNSDWQSMDIETYTTKSEIRIPIPKHHINILISYLYNDKIELNDANSALHMYVAANKLNCNQLKIIAKNFLWKNQNWNVLTVLEKALELNDGDLKDLALEKIIRDTENVIRLPNITSINAETLATILEQDALNIKSEMQLLYLCIRWAEAQKLNSEQSLRAILEPFLTRIRFRCIDPKEFAKIIIPMKIFTADEDRQILIAQLTDSENMPPGFSTLKERSKKLPK